MTNTTTWRRDPDFLNFLLVREGEGEGGEGTGGDGGGDGGTGDSTAGNGDTGGGTGGGRSEPVAAEVERLVNMRVRGQIDQLRDDTRRAVQAELERKYGAQLSELDELNELRAREVERQRREAEAEGNYEKAVQSVKDEYAKKEEKLVDNNARLLAELRHERVSGRLQSAAAGKALKPEQVALLLAGRIKLDDESLEVTVLDDNGNPMFDGGKPMSVEGMVNLFLDENKHMAIPTSALDKGSGSGGSGGRDSDALDPEIDALEKQLETARDRAARTKLKSDVTAAFAISNKLNLLKAEKAKQAA